MSSIDRAGTKDGPLRGQAIGIMHTMERECRGAFHVLCEKTEQQ
jgi:hypothetical protein